MTPGKSLSPDVVQMRAMAHPLRLRMLGMLRSDGPATASGLAQRLGLNSGATSYHLRQLADAGLIVDDPDRGSGRDRWWAAAHETTTVDTAEVTDPGQLEAMRAYLGTVVGQMVRQLQDSANERADLPKEWADIVDSSDWQLHLTPAQSSALSTRLHALIDEVRADLPADPGDDTAPVVFQLHTFPQPGRVATGSREDEEQRDE